MVVSITGSLLLGVAPQASAHPLGNATVNHYDGLHLYPDHIEDLAVEDVAEIPTLQRKSSIDADGDGTISPKEAAAYAGRQCAARAAAGGLTVAGRPVPLTVSSARYTERPGAISLKAGRLECRLTGAVDLTARAAVTVDDGWDGAGIGWHEITATGTDVSLVNSPFPANSISNALVRYPNNLLTSPLDVRSGSLTVVPGGGVSTYVLAKKLPVAGPVLLALNRLANTFNGLVGRKHLTVGVGVLAILLSMALGAGHAFLPGHGKTIMAAYLVGRRGRLRDVVTVGATVTITHTAGVLVLGLALTLSAAFAPTQAEQYLGILSGLIVAGVGVGLLVSALRRRRSAARDLVATVTADTAILDAVAQERAVVGAPSNGNLAVSPGTALNAPLSAPHLHPHDEHAHEHPTTRHEHEDPLALQHPHGHGHGHGHQHSHGPGGHTHGPGQDGFSRGGLIGLGVAGGLVPSPSALLVLLAAIALGRTVFGVVLVLGYGLGMAGALSAAGLLLVRLRGRLDKYAASPRLARVSGLVTILPVLTALLVLAVGVGLTLRAVGGTV
ncbi:MAG: hypothetical protein NVSMB55_05980 [Mycobacteriales bacterium]